MRRNTALVVAVLMLINVSPIFSELESNEDEIPRLTQADLNCVWLESKVSQTLGYNTLKVVNAYVGQTLTETFEIRNKTKETLNYSLTTELMDCENKEVWQDGDRLAMKLGMGKLTLKAGEKKQLPVTIQVQKNHSGNAYFHINITPSKGKKEFVSLNICQFDTKADIMTTKPPAMFKTLSDALKNKTKLGRLIRKPDKTFLIYGNIHLFCFETKTRKFSWHYNNKVSIVDLWIYGNYIFTQKLEKITIKNGKLCLHDDTLPDSPKDDYIIIKHNILHEGMINVWVKFAGINCDNPEYLGFKQNISSTSSWGKVDIDDSGVYWFDCILPGRLDVVWIYKSTNCSDTAPGLIACDLLTGKLIYDAGKANWYKYKREYNVICFFYDYHPMVVIDILTMKVIFTTSNDKIVYRPVFCDTGSSIIFADSKQLGSFDYSKRKLAWRIYGDGEPVCDPAYDKNSDSVYLLDCASSGSSENPETKDAQYLRLFKFNANMGRQYWKAILFKLPNSGNYDYGDVIKLEDNKVVVNYYGYTFTVRASDGKPSK